MTVGDSELIVRANSPAAGAAMPMVPASDLRPIVEALARLGYDTPPLLAVIGVDEATLADVEGRVRCDAYGALVAAAMRQRPLTVLALRIAAEIPLGAYPLLDYVVLSSTTVRDGLEALVRYHRLTSSPVVVELRAAERPPRLLLHAGADAAFGVEFVAGLAAKHLRAETEGRLRLLGASFAHALDDVAQAERILGCPVTQNASWSGLAFAADDLLLPLRRRDPILRELLERQADELSATMPELGAVAMEVRHGLQRRLAAGLDVRMAVVARELATSARTLQRRLAATGLSYATLLDEVRREMAERHLRDPRLAAAQVGYLLGFSEPAAFHRAFRRWTGTTPQAFRRGAGVRPTRTETGA